MKYLKKFNEAINHNQLTQVKYDIEDILLEVGDLNVGGMYDFLYRIDTYSNSSSMRDCSISGTFRIDVRFWKNGGFFRYKEFEKLKPIFDRLVRIMEPISSGVKLVISQWDEDENEYYEEIPYDGMAHLPFDVGVLPSKITGFKLKFDL